jgi:hypothetical protein
MKELNQRTISKKTTFTGNNTLASRKNTSPRNNSPTPKKMLNNNYLCIYNIIIE